MRDIFISYARSDIKITKALAEVFEQQGWSVWWDTEISTEETFADVIEKELDSSISCIFYKILIFCFLLWEEADVF